MTLDIPTLDDREYDDIVEDARKSIAVHSTAWTDHNVHDPGITILELLAWLTETYGYQFDRITDAHRHTYLRLAGRPPAPPTTATALVQFTPASDAHGREVEAETALVADDGGGAVRQFETTRDVTLTVATLETVLSDYPTGRTDSTEANRRAGLQFFAFGEAAEPGSALYLGFDGDPFALANAGSEPPSLSLTFEYAADVPPAAPAFDVGLPTLSFDEALSNGDEDPTGAGDGGGGDDDALDGDAATGDATDEAGTGARPAFTPSVRLVWEYCTAYDRWHDDGVWEPFVVREDETNRLYEGGTVTLELPEEPEVGPWPDAEGLVLDATVPRYWVRCRVAGPADAPGYEVPPRLDSIRLNVVPAAQRATAGTEHLSRADGESLTSARPGQRFLFGNRPVLAAAVRVDGERWTPVDHFDASGPNDPHYVLDHQTGEVRFGDGERGRVPPAGVPVTAASYTYGGGTASNVSESASWRLALPDPAQSPPPAESPAVTAVRPLAGATGGTDAESLDDAFEALRDDLRTTYRAVTAADYRELALATPGLRFGRAHAVAASASGREGDGCAPSAAVRVVVVPYSPETRPVPSEGFLDAVRCHLRRNALLTDRVTVEPPTYVDVDVAATVRLVQRADPTDRAAAVERRIESFLAPLTGFEGGGWPFGRPVYLSELNEAIGGVDGVDCVLDAAVSVGGSGSLDADGNAVFDDVALPVPRSVSVQVEPARDHCGGAS